MYSMFDAAAAAPALLGRLAVTQEVLVLVVAYLMATLACTLRPHLRLSKNASCGKAYGADSVISPPQLPHLLAGSHRHGKRSLTATGSSNLSLSAIEMESTLDDSEDVASLNSMHCDSDRETDDEPIDVAKWKEVASRLSAVFQDADGWMDFSEDAAMLHEGEEEPVQHQLSYGALARQAFRNYSDLLG